MDYTKKIGKDTSIHKEKLIKDYVKDHPEEFPLDEELLKELKKYKSDKKNLK